MDKGVLFAHALGGCSFVRLTDPHLEDVHQHVEAVSGISKEEQRLVCLGRNLESDAQFQQLLKSSPSFLCIRVSLRIVGGKGGFGSLLRSARSTKKTTNFSACRDRNGNRLRDVDIARRVAEHERTQREGGQEQPVEIPPEPQAPVVDMEARRREQRYQETRKEILSDVVSSVSEGYRTSSQKKKQEQALKRKREEADMDTLWGPEMEEKEEEEEADMDTLWGPEMEEKEEKEEKMEKEKAFIEENEEKEKEETVTEEIKPQKKERMPLLDRASFFPSSQQRFDSTTDSKARVTTLVPTLTTTTNDTRRYFKKEPNEPKSTEEKEEKETIDLSSFQSLEQLEALDLEVLKLALIERKMKCGGTKKQRAERLWAVRGLSQGQIDPSLLAVAGKKPAKRRKLNK